MGLKKVPLKHIGNGVVIVGHSGAIYNAAPGEVVNFLPGDAEGLKNHPEWKPVPAKKAAPSLQEGESK